MVVRTIEWRVRAPVARVRESFASRISVRSDWRSNAYWQPLMGEETGTHSFCVWLPRDAEVKAALGKFQRPWSLVFNIELHDVGADETTVRVGVEVALFHLVGSGVLAVAVLGALLLIPYMSGRQAVYVFVFSGALGFFAALRTASVFQGTALLRKISLESARV